MVATLSSDKTYFTYKTKSGDLLYFSKISGCLYGFNEIGNTIFSSLEEKIVSKEELLQSAGDNDALETLIHTISNLREGKEDLELTQSKNWTLEYPPLQEDTQYINPFYYKLSTFIFVIDTEYQLIIEKILVTLSDLNYTPNGKEEVALHITFSFVEGKWFFCFNGKVVSRALQFDELLSRLLDYIRISYYHSINYLVSLHSGVLYFNKKPLLLPAVSGSGKSTLSTYLMDNHFEFLSDEVALIDKEGYMVSIPLAITLKEGSWSVLEEYGIQLKNLLIHKRFDGQNVRFLPPKNIATENLSVEGAYLIFPQYVKDQETHICSISTLEALNMITKSGYEVIDSYDERTIEKWITYLEGFHKFTVTYSNLEDARQNIIRIMG